MIMVRILHLETLLSVLTVKEGESLSCSFAVIDPILTGNSRIWKLCSQEDGRIQVTETEDSQGVLTIGALTELVFGYRSAADLRRIRTYVLAESWSVSWRKFHRSLRYS